MKNISRNVDKLSELQRSGYSLFHSEMCKEIKSFEKAMFNVLNGNAVYNDLKCEMSVSQELNAKGIEDALF